MFEIYQFEPEHVMPLIQQPMNADMKPWFDEAYAVRLKNQTLAYTGCVANEVMVCFGLARLWGRRAYLWCVFSETMTPYSLPVYRGFKRMLQEQDFFDRIEMDVPTELEIAHRRAQFLGFELECGRAKRYSPRGEDRSLYAWVRQ